MTAGFFDPYPLFYRTRRNPPDPEWIREKLNRRHEILIAPNRDLIKARTVLDIASHDGRWSFASLEAGAHSVVGIEPRTELVQAAEENFRQYGVDPERYRFIVGDVFDVLKTQRLEVDVVFCSGFLYHAARHVELFSLMNGLDCESLIIDSTVSGHSDAVVALHHEDVGGLGRAFPDRATFDNVQIVGWPSRKALEVYLRHFGYRIDRISEYDQRNYHRVALVATRASTIAVAVPDRECSAS